jgi:hypothetical protein
MVMRFRGMGEPTLLWHYGRITMPDITGTLVNSSIRFVIKPGPFLEGGGGRTHGPSLLMSLFPVVKNCKKNPPMLPVSF